MGSSNGQHPDPLMPAKVNAAAKRAVAIHLRSAGYDLGYIASKVGFSSIRAVRTAISGGLKEMQSEATHEMKAQELHRLDIITARLWTVIEPYLADDADPSDYPVNGHTMDAIALYLKVSERRAKITGMESTKLEITSGGDGRAPVQVQIVQDVERFQRFVQERVIEMQEGRPRIKQAEVVKTGNENEEDDSGDFSIAALDRFRGGEGGGRSGREGSDHWDGGGVVPGNWSDSRGGTGVGGPSANPALLSPDPEREAI